MAVELHIWGPAFGLPSIDAECIAATALLQQTLTPRQIEWKLVPDHDPSTSPTNQFPLLINGSTRVSGYAAIVKHLQATLSIDVDGHLSTTQRADAVATISFLKSYALPLIDIYLYTTFQTYYNVTRRAYTAILPWHTNYVYPPQRLAEARARTQHLGLSSLDGDALTDDLDQMTSAPGGSTISGQFEATKRAAETGRQKGPSLLPLGRRSLRSVLGSSTHSDRFKLSQLADRCFNPLTAMIGGKSYLHGDDSPSAADYLTFGYLSLMFYPECPHPWLRDTLKTRHAPLAKYIERLRELCFGAEEMDAFSIMRSSSVSSLPWTLPEMISVQATTITIGRELLGSIPIPATLSNLDPQAPFNSCTGMVTRLLACSGLVLSVLVGLGYHFATQQVPSWDYEFRASDFVDSTNRSFSESSSSYGVGSDFLSSLGEALNPTFDLDADQVHEKERLGGAIVGEVEVTGEAD